MPSSQTASAMGIRLAAGLVILGLGACSPYAFSGGAQALSTKMAAIDTASKDTTQKIAAENRQAIDLGWVRDRPQLARGPGCQAGAPASLPCDLIVFGTPDTSPAPSATVKKPAALAKDVCEPLPAAAEPPKPSAALTRQDIPKRLDDYFAALAAITNAKDRSDFDTASAQIGTAVGGLAETAGTPGVGTLAKASTNAAFWLVGEGLDNQRLEELRRATRVACQPIHVLADALKAVLEEQQERRMAGLTKLLILQVQTANRLRTTPATQDDAYATAVEDARTTADAYQAVRATDPAATAQAVSDAHDALVVAVRDNDGQFGPVVATLTALADQVATLDTAAKAAPAKPKAK